MLLVNLTKFIVTFILYYFFLPKHFRMIPHKKMDRTFPYYLVKHFWENSCCWNTLCNVCFPTMKPWVQISLSWLTYLLLNSCKSLRTLYPSNENSWKVTETLQSNVQFESFKKLTKSMKIYEIWKNYEVCKMHEIM